MRLWLRTLLFFTASCATDPITLGTDCPRTDLPPCAPESSGCAETTWSYFLCLAEAPPTDPPQLRFTERPGAARWPVRSLAAHRFALASLRLWGEGEVAPESVFEVWTSSIAHRSGASIAVLARSYAEFLDRPRVGSPRGATTFAESLDLHRRIQGRAGVFEAMVRAALEGGSYFDYIDPNEPGLGRSVDTILEASSPLARLLQVSEEETIGEAGRQLTVGWEAFERLLIERSDVVGLETVLAGPELPPELGLEATEVLGPEVVQFVSRALSPAAYESDRLLSGRSAGGNWFMWRVETRYFRGQDLLPEALRAQSLFAEGIPKQGPGWLVIAAESEATLDLLRPVAEAWLESP